MTQIDGFPRIKWEWNWTFSACFWLIGKAKRNKQNRHPGLELGVTDTNLIKFPEAFKKVQ